MSTPNRILGAYRLLEPLGEGAMGSVWKALDLRLERPVALKLLKDVDEVRHRALVAEAKLASRLNHPNVAHVYEAGEAEGIPYIAMELVEGRTLRTFVGERVSVEWLLHVAEQAAAGLSHAHGHGVIHRDIKPENMVLREDGTLKVLDFGIARPHGATIQVQSTHHHTLIDKTAPGYSQGTPAYMSPEQANGEELGPATDQFSLGVVLYQLAVGFHPFLKPNLVETLFSVVKDQPAPLTQLRPDLPVVFAQGIGRLMAKSPEARYAGLEEFVRELRGEAETVKVHPLPARRRWTLSFGFILPLLLGAGLLGALLFRQLGQQNGVFGEARKVSGQDLAAGRQVLAVLPLEQRGGDEAQSWMSSSLADALALVLSRQPNLAVVDRLRVLEVLHQLGEKPGRPLQSLGGLVQSLRLHRVLQGSYVVSGDRVRVTVTLLDPATGTTLKQCRVEGNLGDILALEDQLQERVPQELGIAAEGAGAQARAKNPQTRELFIKGNQVLVEGNADSLQLAQRFYEEALRLEPDYAPARGALAWALMEQGTALALSSGRFTESQRLFQEAKTEAEKAIARDAGATQAYRALSAVLLRLGDLEGASRAALQGIRLDPTDARAYGVLAEVFLTLEGEDNHRTARRYFEKALALDPGLWHTHHRFAVLLQNAGELEASLKSAQRALSLQPSAELAYVTAVDDLLWLGRASEADALIQAGLRAIPGSRILKSLAATTAWAQGNRTEFERHAREVEASWPENHGNSVLIKGLRDLLRGDAQSGIARFQAHRAEVEQRGYDRIAHNERRVLSVNLYFMARAAASVGRKDAAQALLNLADRLHPGKRKVAMADPAFRR